MHTLQISSPLDAAITKKKRALKKVETKFAGQGAQNQAADKNNTGFSTNISIANCDDGMSPMMQKFNAKKK